MLGANPDLPPGWHDKGGRDGFSDPVTSEDFNLRQLSTGVNGLRLITPARVSRLLEDTEKCTRNRHLSPRQQTISIDMYSPRRVANFSPIPSAERYWRPHRKQHVGATMPVGGARRNAHLLKEPRRFPRLRWYGNALVWGGSPRRPTLCGVNFITESGAPATKITRRDLSRLIASSGF